MKLILFLSFLMGASASAGVDSETVKQVLEAQPACMNSVRYDDNNLYLGFGPYRKMFEEPRFPIPSTIRVVPFSNPGKAYDLSTSDAAIDSVQVGSSLFVLTYSGLEEWDLDSRRQKTIHSTYLFNGVMAYKQHAQAFARYQDKLIIAHGRLGVSFFDLKTKQITRQFTLIAEQFPRESMATAVTLVGKYAYVLMDNFTLQSGGNQPAFRGLVIIDMDQEKVVSQLDGLDAGADAIVSDGKKLFISYAGDPVWTYSLSQFQFGSKSMPAPEHWTRVYPVGGHPIGTPALDDKYYYTCFSKAPPPGAGGPYKQVPMALERRVLN